MGKCATKLPQETNKCNIPSNAYATKHTPANYNQQHIDQSQVCANSDDAALSSDETKEESSEVAPQQTEPPSTSSSNEKSPSQPSTAAKVCANSQQVADPDDEASSSDETKDESPVISPEQAYKNTILRHVQCCSIAGLAQRSSFKQHINDAADPRPKNIKKIMKEICCQLHKTLHLSYDNGAMLVRFDEANPRFLQVVLIGLKDTPYFNGCFLFDVYLPIGYPDKAPLVQHVSNGAAQPKANNGPGGFSPNLHRETGKVCLSLLGTWDGPGWQAGQSNVYQVLSTLLFMVFGAKHPYYMEPGHGGWEGTANEKKKHDKKVIAYDEELLYHTAKCAMLEVLQKRCYVGFEDVVAAHFKAKKEQIVQQMEQVMKDKQYSKGFRRRMQSVCEQMKRELDKL